MADATLDLDDIKRRMDASLASFQHDLSGIRTGRASASLLDPITVDAYGQQMPISQVGTVNVPEPRMIAVQVWDKAMVIPVEKAIRESTLALNPVTDGTTVRIPLPELNEERRKELAKVASTYAENARVAVRHVRRDGMETLKSMEKSGDIPQDDARSLSDKVQKMTDDKISEIDTMLSTKEEEIMQV